MNYINAVVLMKGGSAICRVLLLSCLLLAGCEWEEHTEDLGYRGEARHNPLLAAEMMCEKLDLPGQSLPGFTAWPDSQEIYSIVLPASAFVEGQLSPESALDFLNDGGNLVIYFSGVMGRSELRQNIIDLSPYKTARGLRNFLHHCGISMLIDENDMDLIHVDADRKVRRFKDVETATTHEVMISSVIQFSDNRGRQQFLVERTLSAKKQARGSQPILSVGMGRGRLTLISDGKWMTQKPADEVIKTPEIAELNHASLLWRVVYPDTHYGIDRVQFIYGLEKGFLQLLFNYGWMAILPLMIWLALWLWQGIARFERISEPESEDKRDFAEHIKATGRYWWRHDCQELMIEQLRVQIFARIRKRWPHASSLLQGSGQKDRVTYDLAHESMMSALVSITAMSRETLESVLSGPIDSDPDSFVIIVNQLKRIDASL